MRPGFYQALTLSWFGGPHKKKKKKKRKLPFPRSFFGEPSGSEIAFSAFV
jgi:hypothetical protein